MNYLGENISESEDALAYEEHIIRTGNLAIADFMQLKKLTEDTWINPVLASSTRDLLYHESWGWLMSVVEKIVAIRYDGDETAYLRTFGMRDHDGNYMVRLNWCSLQIGNSLLSATYAAVVEFVVMHNAKKVEKQIKICHICGGENEHTKDCTSYMPQANNP